MAATKGRALIILAEGAEEMEAVITADVLRRGKVGFCLELWCIKTWNVITVGHIPNAMQLVKVFINVSKVKKSRSPMASARRVGTTV